MLNPCLSQHLPIPKGPFLREECACLDGCLPGDAKITLGYDLPAAYVIHTVGPVGEKKEVSFKFSTFI